MASIEDKRQQRAAFMRALYDATNGDEGQQVSTYELTDALGIVRDQVDPLIQFLEGQLLVKPSWDFEGPGSISIAHRGVVEVEEALTDPDQPTEHFAPMQSVTIIGDVHNSQVGVAGGDLSQQATYDGSQTEKVRSWLD